MIEFSNVSKVYPNGVVGLDDVNLTIEQGEFVGIIGLSGAGKSTLLRTINRMHDITSGTLTVDGQEVKNLKGKQLRKFRRNIGMIFQSFNLVTRTTVIRNAERLRLKESDRIAAMEAELRAVGGLVESEGGTITVQGCADRLHAPAGVLHGHNDHRVVMSLAVLSLATGIPLTVDDAEAITKSWPNFFEAIKPLGAEVEHVG